MFIREIHVEVMLFRSVSLDIFKYEKAHGLVDTVVDLQGTKMATVNASMNAQH